MADYIGAIDQGTTSTRFILFDHAGRIVTCAQEEQLNVSVTPEFGVLPMQTMYSSNGWDSYAWGFKAMFDVVDLVIHNPGIEKDPACGPLIDSVAIRTLYPPRITNGKGFFFCS